MFGFRVNVTMGLMLAVGVLGAGLLTYRGLTAGQVDEKKTAGSDKRPNSIAEQLNRMKLELTEKELVQVQSDLRKEGVELAHLKGREKTLDNLPIPQSTIEELINRDSVIDQRLLREAQLRESIAEIESVSAEGSRAPGLRELQSKLAISEKILAARRDKLREQYSKQLRVKTRDEFRTKVAQHEDTISFLKELEAELKADIQRLSQ